MLKFSNHAKQRLKQAEITTNDISVIVKCGSLNVSKRQRRCYSIRTKADKAALLDHLLKQSGIIASDYVKRLVGLTVVISKDDWVITAYQNNLNNNLSLSHQPFKNIGG